MPRTPEQRREYDKLRARVYRARPDSPHLVTQKRYRDKHKEEKKAWARANHHRMKWYILKHDYGISKEEYEQLETKQNNCCAVCAAECKLFVDHCHQTGKIRGLLCRQCNSALGFARDSGAILRQLADYLDAQ